MPDPAAPASSAPVIVGAVVTRALFGTDGKNNLNGIDRGRQTKLEFDKFTIQAGRRLGSGASAGGTVVTDWDGSTLPALSLSDTGVQGVPEALVTAYQGGVPGVAAHRGVPDVSADADQDTGLAAVLVTGGNFVIGPAVGTSASAPFWAAIVALADQYAGRHLGFINPAIYQIGRSAQYHRAFHDITKGNNTVRDGSVTVKGFNATTGWDPATGWGSPDAQVLIPLLARRVTG